MVYPLLLQPTLHTRVWGGRKLETLYGKSLPTSDPYGESWELHDTATIANGPWTGLTLAAVLEKHAVELIGTHNDPKQGFPLLVKLIDAADWLSIQVHPDDRFALQLEGEPRGKTEAWYILDADANAKLVIGVQPGTPREAIAQAIQTNTLEHLLVYAEVKQGDAIYMHAGAIHAIGPGILIYEIQQSSDTTYRLYDWGRMGLDGKPRPLHIEKSLTVANTSTTPRVTHAPYTGETVKIVEGEYFVTLRHVLRASDNHGDHAIALDTEGRVFHALTCIAGEVKVTAGEMTVAFKRGQTVLIPTGLGAYTLHGKGTVLNSMQNLG